MKQSSRTAASASEQQDVRGMTDEVLFAALTREKQTADRAFAELYARHSTRVWAYCRCVFGNQVPAEDVFQEAFTRLFERGRKGTVVGNVPAYLLKTTRNLCLNAKRDAKQTVVIEDFHLTTNDRPLEKKELLELIVAALDLLPDEQREAFFLREFEDLPYEEIGAILGSTGLSARIRVSRARRRVREILQPYVSEYARL